MNPSLPSQTSRDKKKFPRADAIAVAREMVEALALYCVPDRLRVAGSLRRRKAEVGDVEIVYIPKIDLVMDGLFDTRPESAVDNVLNRLLAENAIARRTNTLGAAMWGPKNKLAVHVASGIPVDFFATTEEAFWNYLVCRTGGAEFNTRLCMRAQDKGWKWNPYGEGFTDHRGQVVPVRAERDVFDLLGLKYLEPWER